MKQIVNDNATIKNKAATDRAWERLYTRLDLQGLIPGQPDGHASCSDTDDLVTGVIPMRWRERRISFRRLAWMGAVALVLIVCSYFLSVLFSTEVPVEKTPLLAKENTGEFTLVTTLEEGSVVYLSRKATLYYPEHFLQQKREVKLDGTALFEVEGNRERPFVIETREVFIEVVGTAFNVKNDNGKPFELSVCRGSVKVSLKDGEGSVDVTAGKTVTLVNGGLHLYDTKDVGQFELYAKKMRFKDEPLSNVLRVINMHIPDMQIQTSPLLGERKITVAFFNDSAESMVELISLAMNLKSRMEGNRIFLSE